MGKYFMYKEKDIALKKNWIRKKEKKILK